MTLNILYALSVIILLFLHHQEYNFLVHLEDSHNHPINKLLLPLPAPSLLLMITYFLLLLNKKIYYLLIINFNDTHDLFNSIKNYLLTKLCP